MCSIYCVVTSLKKTENEKDGLGYRNRFLGLKILEFHGESLTVTENYFLWTVRHDKS